MILSHHGKLEFGSPKLPMIPEALVLNFIDDLDAKMQAVAGEFEKCAREGKGPDELTGKVWALDQRQIAEHKSLARRRKISYRPVNSAQRTGRRETGGKFPHCPPSDQSRSFGFILAKRIELFVAPRVNVLLNLCAI